MPYKLDIFSYNRNSMSIDRHLFLTSSYMLINGRFTTITDHPFKPSIILSLLGTFPDGSFGERNIRSLLAFDPQD